MAGWSGGTFTRARDWTVDEAGAVDPTATRFDEEDDNFAAGINACLHKGGQNSVTADIAWGSNKITGLANGTAATDAAAYGQVSMIPVEAIDLTNGGADDQQTVAFSHTFETGYIYKVHIVQARGDDATGNVISLQWAVSGVYNTGASDYVYTADTVTQTANSNVEYSGLRIYDYNGWAGNTSETLHTSDIFLYSFADVAYTTVMMQTVAVVPSTPGMGFCRVSGFSAAAEAHNKLRVTLENAAHNFDNGTAYLYRIKEIT